VAFLTLLFAAVDNDSTAYGIGRIIGTLILVVAVGLAIRSISPQQRKQPLRLKAVLLAIGGVLLTLTIVGELLFVGGLTK
jgi:hypothetical protein